MISDAEIAEIEDADGECEKLYPGARWSSNEDGGPTVASRLLVICHSRPDTAVKGGDDAATRLLALCKNSLPDILRRMRAAEGLLGDLANDGCDVKLLACYRDALEFLATRAPKAELGEIDIRNIARRALGMEDER